MDTGIIIGTSVGIATLLNLIGYNYFFLPKINKSLEDYKSLIKIQDKINEEKWILKRDACMKALEIADSQISNWTFPNVVMDKAPINTTMEVRECINMLNCSCEKPEVLKILKTILFGKNQGADIIVDLRNSIRIELNFDTKGFDTDRKMAFIAAIR